MSLDISLKPEYTPTEAALALKVAIAAQKPAFISGSPGVGKSAVVKQVAADLGMDLLDIRVILLDPVDLRGLPYKNGDDRTHWAVPEFLPREGKGILFLDELNAAPPMTQAACYQLVLDRKIGEYRLPDDWTVLAAGNRETDRAVAHRLPTALANRFVHIDFTADVNDWSQWAIKNGIRPDVIGYLRARPEALSKFDPSAREFPSPRSWEYVSRLLDSNPPKEIEHKLVTGCVGAGAAAEFIGFIRVFRQMISPDAILMNPAKAEVPTDPSALYAISAALASRMTDATAERIITYTNRMPKEYGVVTLKDAISTKPKLQTVPAVRKWFVENNEILL